MVTLKYKDETDRAYGLSGMSVCMCMMENERFIDSVNLDSEPDKGLAFTSDFFYPHNQERQFQSFSSVDRLASQQCDVPCHGA